MDLWYNNVQSTLPLLQVANVPDSIPANSKRGLMKALVLLGSAQEDKATREAYWGQVFTPCFVESFDEELFKVLTPLETRYQAIVGRDNLKAIYMEAKVSTIAFPQPLVWVYITTYSGCPGTRRCCGCA